MFFSSSPKPQKSFLSMLLRTFRTCVAAPKNIWYPENYVTYDILYLWQQLKGWSCPFCILESGSTPVFQSDIRQFLLTTQVAESSITIKSGITDFFIESLSDQLKPAALAWSVSWIKCNLLHQSLISGACIIPFH